MLSRTPFSCGPADLVLSQWLIAMWTRLGWAAISMLLISNFPKGDIGMWYFLLVVACTVGSSFSRCVPPRPFQPSPALIASPRSTVQFVGISAFHTQIADPLIGGTYMTVRLATAGSSDKLMSLPQLLNTVSNLGGTWPKFFVLKGIDAFSVAVCHVKDEGLDVIVSSASRTWSPISCPLILGLAGRECVSDHGKAACAELGGTCLTERDGYYWVSTLCILAGVAILVSFVQPVARKLQGMLACFASKALLGSWADTLRLYQLFHQRHGG